MRRPCRGWRILPQVYRNENATEPYIALNCDRGNGRNRHDFMSMHALNGASKRHDRETDKFYSRRSRAIGIEWAEPLRIRPFPKIGLGEPVRFASQMNFSVSRKFKRSTRRSTCRGMKSETHSLDYGMIRFSSLIIGVKSVAFSTAPGISQPSN